MIRKILKVLAGLAAAVVIVLAVVYVATNPQQPPADSSSARWLEPGPYPVAQAEFIFVDTSRGTAANGGFPAKADRTFATTIWYPAASDAAHPLIVHSHGILSNRAEMPYLAEALASRGYVFAAADYPLSSGSTEGGATADDVGNQATDVSFLIDSVLALSDEEKPFEGSIDQARIGLSG